jgi:hypothetical protein
MKNTLINSRFFHLKNTPLAPQNRQTNKGSFMTTSSLSSSSLVKRSLSKSPEEPKNPLQSIFSSSTPILDPQPKYLSPPLSVSSSPPAEDRSLMIAPQIFSNALNFSKEPLPVPPSFSSWSPPNSDKKNEVILPEESPVQDGIIIKSSAIIPISNAKPISALYHKAKRNITLPKEETLPKLSDDKTREFKGDYLESHEREEGLFFLDLEPLPKKSKRPSIDEISPSRLDQENAEENEL